jgi:hypothetical protein
MSLSVIPRLNFNMSCDTFIMSFETFIMACETFIISCETVIMACETYLLPCTGGHFVTRQHVMQDNRHVFIKLLIRI